MSIKADVTELELIRSEMKILSDRRRKLKEKEKIVEARISQFLKSKDQPGVKHNGTAIILTEGEKALPKKPKQKDADTISVLKKYGIKDAEKVLKELLDARKGEKTTKETLKITKYKENQN